MKIEKINDSLMTKISDVRKSPMDYFNLSKQEKKEVYVLNNNSVAGIMIDKDTFDQLNNYIQELEDEILYLNVEKRINDIQQDPSNLVSEQDVLGNRLDNVEWSENDGWE